MGHGLGQYDNHTNIFYNKKKGTTGMIVKKLVYHEKPCRNVFRYP